MRRTRCARAHAAVPARLREAVTQRARRDGREGAAPRDPCRPRRQPRCRHGRSTPVSAIGPEWGEDLLAGYVNYVLEQPKYALELGFRGEQAEVRYDLPPENIYYSQSDAYDYFEPLPNVRFTYNVSEVDRLAVYYNNRVDRPGEAGAARLSEVRRPGAAEGRQSVSAAAIYRALRARVRAAVGAGLCDRVAVPAEHRRSIRASALRSIRAIPDYDIVNRIYQNVGSGTHGRRGRVQSRARRALGAQRQRQLVRERHRRGRRPRCSFPSFGRSRCRAPTTTPGICKAQQPAAIAERPGGAVRGGATTPRSPSLRESRPHARRSTSDSRSPFDERADLVLSVTDLFNEFGLRHEIKAMDSTRCTRISTRARPSPSA